MQSQTPLENAHVDQSRPLGEQIHDSTTDKEEYEREADVEKAAEPTPTEDEDTRYPSFKVILPTMLSIYLAVFLAALDRTIISVAVPRISDEFKSFGQIAWYEASYLLSFCALQLPTGRLYTMFPAKWIFIVLVTIFEVGSVVCAAAPNSNAFIVGRTITGIGGSGIVSGATVLLMNLLPLRKRPKYQGLIGAVFGLASILGPLLGGVFTTKATWRWCFWINLPIGGVALVLLVLILPRSPPAQKFEGSFWQKILKLDPMGSALLIPSLICLLFALQLGGDKYPWDDARVIACLVLSLVLLLAFIAVEIWIAGDDGIVPLRIIRQRTMAAGIFVNLGLGAAFICTVFYLPIWFQAVKDLSAVKAGERLLSYFLSSTSFVIGSGIAVSATGYYAPWLTVGTALVTVGSGLLTSLRLDTSSARWIGYQIVVGAGVGMSLQQPVNAAQTVLPDKDIPVGVTILGFSTILGGAIFVTVGQTVLANTLTSQLSSKIAGFDSSAVVNSGATEIRNLVSPAQLPEVLEAYNMAINNVFYVALALACLAFSASLFVEWKSVKKAKKV